MKNIFRPLFLLGLTAIVISCDKEGVNIDPKEAILGKWETIENSYGPVEPDGYKEYMPDGLLIMHNYYEEGIFYQYQYWFSDSLLYQRYPYIDQVSGDTILVDTQPYRFKFLDHDRLRLDLQQPAIVTTFIYQRIK